MNISVAQAGSNDEKDWWLKISLDCPLNNDVSISKYNTFACTVLHKRRVICKNYQIFSNTIYTFYTLRAIPAAWLRVFIYFEHSRTWGVCLQESQALQRVWTEQLFLMSEKTLYKYLPYFSVVNGHTAFIYCIKYQRMDF